MSRDVDALLRELDWAQVSARILAFALKRTGSRARATDLAQESMMRALDARWNPWDPQKDPDVVTFLIKIVNRLLTNEHQKRRLHREIAIEEEMKDDEDAQTARPLIGTSNPEARAASRELYRQRMGRLRERLAGDQVALDILEQTELGVDLPEEQAAATGHSLHDIHTARRRRAFHAERVARELGDHEGGGSSGTARALPRGDEAR